MKKKSKITCLVKNVSKLTCVVKVKLNVVNARLCDAWWLGRRGSWQDKIMKGDESILWYRCDLDHSIYYYIDITNVNIACIARCAGNLWTKHWFWPEHVPEQECVSYVWRISNWEEHICTLVLEAWWSQGEESWAVRCSRKRGRLPPLWHIFTSCCWKKEIFTSYFSLSHIDIKVCWRRNIGKKDVFSQLTFLCTFQRRCADVAIGGGQMLENL